VSEGRAYSPGLEFVAWFIDEGLRTGAIPKHYGLDRKFAMRQQNAELSAALVAAHGIEECKLRAKRLFEEILCDRIHRSATIDTLSDAWAWRNIRRPAVKDGSDFDLSFRKVRA
jgi:hypothetical protein